MTWTQSQSAQIQQVGYQATKNCSWMLFTYKKTTTDYDINHIIGFSRGYLGRSPPHPHRPWRFKTLLQIISWWILSCDPSTITYKEKVHFWPSNSGLSLILAIELQNRISLAIQLSKPFKFDHRAVLVGGFNFFYLQLSP